MIDEAGNQVPHQIVQQEAACQGLQRFLFPISLDPGQLKNVRIVKSGACDVKAGVSDNTTKMRGDTGVYLTQDALGFPSGALMKRPNFALIDDPTDTWSHGIDRYSDKIVSVAAWEPACVRHCY